MVCLYTPVSPSVPEMEGIYATGGILFWGWTFGRLYIPCICSHARWSYRGRFRSLLLCPLSFERCYFPLLIQNLYGKQGQRNCVNILLVYSIINHRNNYYTSLSVVLPMLWSPASSPSRGGDVTVYVYDINQPRLHNLSYSVLVSISVLMPFQLYFIP